MISNQCYAQTKRRIIRTLCFFSRSKQMTGTVSVQSDDRTESLSVAAAAHVLAADKRHE